MSKVKWILPQTGDTISFSGVSNYDELIPELQEQFLEIIGKSVGIEKEWKPKPNQELRPEEVVLIRSRILFERLEKIFRGKEFDKEIALNVINLTSTIQNLISEFAFEAYQNGRKEIAEWAIKIITLNKKEQKIKLEKKINQIRKYAPNKKYSDEQFIYFEDEWKRLHSQKQAYDSVAEKYSLPYYGFENFVRAYRNRRPIERKSETSIRFSG